MKRSKNRDSLQNNSLKKKYDRMIRRYLLHEEYIKQNESPYFDAWEDVMDLVREKPEDAWEVLKQLILKAKNKKALCAIGAGALEDFIKYHGHDYLTMIRDEALQRKKFMFALACVWTDNNQIQNLVKNAIEQDPEYFDL